MSRWKFMVFAGVLAWSVVATAQVAPEVPEVPKPRAAAGLVDARFDGLRNVLEKFGPDSAFFGPNGLQSGRADGVAGLLWFDEALSAEQLAKLEAAGVEWTRNARGVARVGSVYSAFVRFEALDALRAAPGLILAEVAWRPVVVRPLDVTTAEIGAAAARNMPNMEATGAGVVIGDIDSGIDVLHPHFFHADAGAYRWLDTNGDGVFTPGVDHVDLNGDGVGGSNELAHVLDGAYVTSDQRVSNDDGVLDVALDWVYVDANSDGERNAGPGAFFEDTPGYGEPIFVPDDANGDGVLGLDERLLRLGTSKVLRFTTNERIFVRGVDMIEAANFPNLDYAMHGTGVASILLGGHAGRARSGLAPDAELVMYTGSPDVAGSDALYAGAFAALEDAVAHRVDMVVHEWTDPTMAFLDGGGAFEEAMRVAREAGVVQVNPLGNLNWSQKHTEVDAPTGVTAFDFIVGSDYYGAPYSVVYASLHASSATFPTQVELVDPHGNRRVLPMDGGTASLGDAIVWGALTPSARGSRQLLLTVWNPDNRTSIAQGTWRLNVELDAATRITGRVTDYYSAWDVGVRWQNPVVDRGTVVFPATADAAIGVAAYGGRHVMDYDGNTGAGQLRNFSGRGPRIDGARVVDLAAPDDPFAALVAGPGYVAAGYGRTWFTTFGGTSGAGPHVAGTVALMRSQQPDLTPDAIEARLLATARRDNHTAAMLPDEAWGSGKLDTYAAVYGVSADHSNRNPVAVLQRVGEVVSAEASSDPDGDALLARWDVDYDGTWDTDWTSELTIPAVAGATVRLELRDGRGGRAGAVLLVDELGIEGPMEHAPDAGGDAGDDGELVIHDLLGDRPCGCASTGEASGSALLFALLFVGGWARRCVRRQTLR